MKFSNSKAKINGFTLIEFLVASSLAIIVIMAAGSTYLMTRQLNNAAQTRINVQNDIRNATTLLTRDARMAGGFGCFTTGGIFTGNASMTSTNSGNFPDLSQLNDLNATIRLNNTQSNGYGVVWTDDITGIDLPNGARRKTNALIFIYGQGYEAISSLNNSGSVTLSSQEANLNPEVKNAITAQGPLILSSCKDAYLIKPTNLNNSAMTFDGISNSQATNLSNSTIGSLSVSKLYAVAYFVATINNTDTLVRYHLTNNGTWSENPQILASNISNMEVSFGYEQNCNLDLEIPSQNRDFSTSAAPSFTNLPALLQVKLTYAGSVQSDYIINANVRGGNQCTTRSN